MPDLSMCMDAECPSRTKCFRFTAETNERRQTYTDFPRDGDKCEWFEPIRDSEAEE